MPVTLNDEEVREMRDLLHDLVRNPFAGGEINAMGGLRAVLSRGLLDKLCIQAPENRKAELLRSMPYGLPKAGA
jgi:hypothetical protein